MMPGYSNLTQSHSASSQYPILENIFCRTVPDYRLGTAMVAMVAMAQHAVEMRAASNAFEAAAAAGSSQVPQTKGFHMCRGHCAPETTQNVR